MSVSNSPNALAEAARLMGDPTRAAMLLALMSGQALTAGELSDIAGVTPQTGSAHLARLFNGRVVAVTPQGRHRYYRLASPEVADVIHGLMGLPSSDPIRRRVVGPRDAALRLARSCYDHLGGRLAVAIADSLIAQGHIQMDDDGASVTPNGRRFFGALGLDLESAGGGRRPLCRTCLDWSERRPHIAGRTGAALLALTLERNWVSRRPGSRILDVPSFGRVALSDTFRLSPGWAEVSGAG